MQIMLYIVYYGKWMLFTFNKKQSILNQFYWHHQSLEEMTNKPLNISFNFLSMIEK